MTTPFPEIGTTTEPLPRRRHVTVVRQIQEAVADYFSLRVSDLTSARRGRREALEAQEPKPKPGEGGAAYKARDYAKEFPA